MAILFMEGFDGYANTTDLGDRYNVGESSPGTSISSGRINGNSLYIDSYDDDFYAYFPESSSTHWVVFAMWESVASRSTTYPVMDVRNGGSVIWGIYRVTGNSYTIKIGGSGGTAIGSSFQIPQFEWAVLEVTVYVHDTAGTVLVKVNGAIVVNETSQDTKPGTATTIDRIGTNSGTGTLGCYYDDIVVGDDSGTDLTASPGDVHIEQLLPDGDGATNNWTPQGAGANYVEVDEATNDGDTTYVSTSTAADKDLYTFANLTETPGTVYAVQVFHKSRKENAGYRTMGETIRSNVTETDSTAQAINTAYVWYDGIFENDPDGGGAWDEAAVNAMQCGIELKT